MMRPFTDRPEVTEAFVVTVSDELGISRSLVYRLVAKFRAAATGSLIEAAGAFTDNHPRAPANSRESGLSTI
jgi:hypothetical protein